METRSLECTNDQLNFDNISLHTSFGLTCFGFGFAWLIGLTCFSSPNSKSAEAPPQPSHRVSSNESISSYRYSACNKINTCTLQSYVYIHAATARTHHVDISSVGAAVVHLAADASPSLLPSCGSRLFGHADFSFCVVSRVNRHWLEPSRKDTTRVACWYPARNCYSRASGACLDIFLSILLLACAGFGCFRARGVVKSRVAGPK